MANIRQTIEDVEKLDPELAQQIRKYVKEHAYGLVYESNLPEAVRLYTKTPSVNDTVNIRPPRGQEEREEHRQPWTVKDIHDGTATIDNGQEQRQVPTDDLVTIVSCNDIIYPGLREVDRIERGNKDDPYQVVINAENYHALEMLAYCYAGKVDCIYIDPPYNTGAKDWKYNNDYVDSNDKYRHSKWLAFMERRLKLAKQLLNPKDSVLICTIDDNELATLTLLIEQLFPDFQRNIITIQMNPGGTQGEAFSVTNEYAIVVYPPTATICKQKYIGDDAYNLRRWGSTSGRYEGATCFYPIIVNQSGNVVGFGDVLPNELHPSAEVELRDDGNYNVWPIDVNGTEKKWRYARATVESVYGRIFTKKNGKRIEVLLRRVDEAPRTVWTKSAYNSEANGSKLLKDLIGKGRFDYPKSVYAVHDCLYLAVANKPNALIVDFFGGSGTTLHAVNLLNAEDGGKRRCVCVTNNEVSVEEQKALTKKGLRPGDPEWEARGIARYVTWPRTKCSIEGVDVNGNPLKGEYGCLTDSYEPYDADIIDPETGKKARGKAYRKVKTQIYPDMEGMKMSDGFKANAIFFDLTYESEWPIRLDNAFDAIAPILWMQAGCRGPIIHRVKKSYLITDYYGVLFKYGQASAFVSAVRAHPDIKTVFVVTDDQRRFSNMCRRLPGVDVHRLYESFLQTFKIHGEGGLD